MSGEARFFTTAWASPSNLASPSDGSRFSTLNVATETCSGEEALVVSRLTPPSTTVGVCVGRNLKLPKP